MAPNQHDLQIAADVAEIKTRVIAIEAAVSGLPLKVDVLERDAKRQRGFIKYVIITFGGGISILIGDLLIRLLHLTN